MAISTVEISQVDHSARRNGAANGHHFSHYFTSFSGMPDYGVINEGDL
jgi:hypothetical protein